MTEDNPRLLPGFADWRTRHGIPIITTPVADVSDAELFPNIAAAIDHARKLRKERP